MKVADIFVEIGLKGADTAGKALGQVQNSLKGVTSTGLATKAAIVGIVYSLERMMSSSMQLGTSLTNFGASTGLNIKTLQQYQYAGKQVGVSFEETEASVRAVQKAMTDMQMGLGAPVGLARVQEVTGMLMDPEHLNDTYYVMQKLQEAYQKLGPAMGAGAVGSFGVTTGVQAAFGQNAYRPDVMARAPTMSDQGLKALQAQQAQWANMWNDIEKKFNKLTLEHGGQLVKDIAMISTEILRLVETLNKLANATGAFKWIAEAFKGWSLLLDLVNTKAEEIGDAAGKGKLGSTILDTAKEMMMLPFTAGEMAKDAIVPMFSKSKTDSQPKVNNTNITVNQSGIENTHQSVNHLKKDLKNAISSSPVNGRSN